MIMDPRDVLRPEKLSKEERRPEPTSPATDLAMLRNRRKKGVLSDTFDKLINMKWRARYTTIYLQDRADMRAHPSSKYERDQGFVYGVEEE